MKYIIELEKIEGTELFRAKGCNTLVFDQNGIDKILKPLKIEGCPFKKDELVEVSEDGIDWWLRYFSRMDGVNYYAYTHGLRSTETGDDNPWCFCRKYGTLGGIAKEQNE